MSIATGIESLKRLVDRLAEGGADVASELVEQMRSVETEAREAALQDLSRLCEVAAETVELLATSAELPGHRETVIDHLRQVITFAERCGVAPPEPQDPIQLDPPALLGLPSGDEERLFAETVGMFVGTAIGSLAELEGELLALESDAAHRKERIATIRRTVHTLKAEFGLLNMGGPQALCHQAETTIDACTEHEAAFPVDVLLVLGDHLRQFVERLALDVKARFGDAEPLLARLRDVAAAAAAGSSRDNGDARAVRLEVAAGFTHGLPAFLTEVRSQLAIVTAALVDLSRDHGCNEAFERAGLAYETIQRIAGFLDLTVIGELAQAAAAMLRGGQTGQLQFGVEDRHLVHAAGDMVSGMLEALGGGQAPKVGACRSLLDSLHRGARRRGPEVHAAGSAPSSERREPTRAAGEPAAKPAAEARHEQVLPAPPLSAPSSSAPAPMPLPSAGSASRAERTVKVSTTRLDMLVDMVGELVIAQSMVLQDPAIQGLAGESLTRNIGQVGKITRDLQEAAMSLRMVTVKATFQKMARVVRDLAARSGKQVTLSIVGEDTELDRNVVEQISEPLVHLIRNAIDHGIELPQERAKTGKDPQARLTLEARHQGGAIVIEIVDDGRGIDCSQVLRVAAERGLLPAGAEVSAMSDEEVMQLIFTPGFSTATEVTDLSGRGVGMDVVRRNIEGLRGKIEVDSRVGGGTRFRLRLPLTLAIIDGMIVRVGGNRYVVPTLSIEHSFRPTPHDLHRLVDRLECATVRGAVLPIHRLKQTFGQEDGLDDLTAGILVVVEGDGQRCCLFVDEILGQQQVVIKSLGLSRERTVGLAGGAIMTDGRVALILDVATLIESLASDGRAAR